MKCISKVADVSLVQFLEVIPNPSTWSAGVFQWVNRKQLPGFSLLFAVLCVVCYDI